MTDLPGTNPPFTTNKAPACPVCDGNDVSLWREAFDDRYGHPDLFHLVRCYGCGHLMTMPMLNEDELTDLYGNYYPRKSLSVDEIASQATEVRLPFSKILRWWKGVDNQGQYSAKSGEKMLDVGCGSGLSLLEARELGVDAWGIEADPNVKRMAEALDLRIHMGSLHDEPFKEVTFDLVVLNQVIEHIPAPDKALALIRSRLSSHGRIILVFPNVNSIWCKLSGVRWINWHIPYHLHHFTKETFSTMAKRCGYNIVQTRTITPNVWTVLQLRAIRQAVVRGQANHMWSVKEFDSFQQSSINIRVQVRRLLMLPVKVMIAVINRIVDSFGFGDSLVVVLRKDGT